MENILTIFQQHEKCFSYFTFVLQESDAHRKVEFSILLNNVALDILIKIEIIVLKKNN